MADPFGNYVVQYILDLKQPALTLQVARALEGSLAELSLQKFSSNVIEKCLTCGEPQVVGLVARELLEGPALASLLHDPFANYVVQTLLNVSTAEHAELILEYTTERIEYLRAPPMLHGDIATFSCAARSATCCARYQTRKWMTSQRQNGSKPYVQA